MTQKTFLREAVIIVEAFDSAGDRRGAIATHACLRALALLLKILPKEIRRLDEDTRRQRAFTD
jgi:hypothetical protein